MTVYLVRHAKPVLPDDRRRYLGHTDAPLSTVGLEQAHQLAERLRPVSFSAAFSSDLQRAASTAQIIVAGTGVRVQTDVRLREIDAGLWEGLSFEEVRERYPKEYAERERDLVGCRFPGGESIRELQQRAVSAFSDILRCGGESILVVAHLGVNRVLLRYAMGLPLEGLFSIEQDYCGVEIVRVACGLDGSWGSVVHGSVEPGSAHQKQTDRR
jgi:alpha-ribazole phosphatase